MAERADCGKPSRFASEGSSSNSLPFFSLRTPPMKSSPQHSQYKTSNALNLISSPKTFGRSTDNSPIIRLVESISPWFRVLLLRGANSPSIARKKVCIRNDLESGRTAFSNCGLNKSPAALKTSAPRTAKVASGSPKSDEEIWLTAVARGRPSCSSQHAFSKRLETSSITSRKISSGSNLESILSAVAISDIDSEDNKLFRSISVIMSDSPKLRTTCSNATRGKMESNRGSSRIAEPGTMESLQSAGEEAESPDLVHVPFLPNISHK